MEKVKVHAGHRQRLKDKVRQNGLKSFGAHEVLELLLTYTIPYKDTNELAHNLINHFGGFANVLDASYDELVKVKDVGHETALFLNSLPDYFDIYKKTKLENSKYINNIKECVQYFRNNMEIKRNEHMYLLCLSPTNKVIRVVDVGGLSAINVSVDVKYITEKIVNIGASTIIICHTHPHGSIMPSEEDRIATSKIIAVCYMLGIVVYDHLIFNESEHYSFGYNGILQELYNKIIYSMKDIVSNDVFAKTAMAQKVKGYDTKG